MKSLLLLLIVSPGALTLVSRAATAPAQITAEMKPCDVQPAADGGQAATEKSPGKISPERSLGTLRAYAASHRAHSPERSAAGGTRALPAPLRADRPATAPKFPGRPAHLFM